MLTRLFAAVPMLLCMLCVTPAALSAEPLAPPEVEEIDDDDPLWMALQTADGDCLEVDGDRLAARACSGASTQVWSFQGDHLVAADGRCLALPARRAGLVGARPTLAPCVDEAGQRFAQNDQAIVDGAGRCLAVGRAGRVRSWACNDESPGQLWTGFAPDAFGEPEADRYDGLEPAVVVQGPAAIYLPPAPRASPPPPPTFAPDPLDQAFRAVDLALGAFGRMVDLVAPGGVSPCRYW